MKGFKQLELIVLSFFLLRSLLLSNKLAMTTLLTTAVDESYQINGTLRGRRLSSVHPLTAIPRLLFTPHSASDYFGESVVDDDVEVTSWTSDTAPAGVPPGPTSAPVVAHISPLSHAHVSDYASKMIVPRHQDSTGGSHVELEMTSLPPTPGGSSTVTTGTTAVNSRRASCEVLLGSSTPTAEWSKGPLAFGEVKEPSERMKWRLAAGYFAFFMCGWGDGSK